MAKRGAEKELTDRNWDRDDRGDDDDGEAEGAFSEAPKAELAVRKIRGMPSRKASPAVISPVASPSLVPATFNFNSLPSTIAPTSSAFSFLGTPAAAPSIVALNPFASLSAFTPAASPVSAPISTFTFSAPPSLPAPAPAASDKLVDYYKSLRSLNLTMLSAVTEAINLDPFINLSTTLTSLLQRYDELRSTIVASNAGGSTSVVAVPVEVAKAVEAVKKVEDKKVPSIGMPAPPTSFSWGGSVVKPSTSNSTTVPVIGGFVPTWTPSNGKKRNDDEGGFSFAKGLVVPGDNSKKEKEIEEEKKRVEIAAAAKEKEETKEKVRRSSLVRGTTPNAPLSPSPLRFGEVADPAVPEKKPFSFGDSFGSIAKQGAIAQKVDTPSFVLPPAPASIPPPASASLTIVTPSPAPTPTAFSFAPSTTAPIPIMAAKPLVFGNFGQSASPPSFSFGAGLSSNPKAASPTFGGFGGGVVGAGGGGAGFGFGMNPSSVAKSTTTGFGFGSANTTSAPAAPFSFGASSTTIPAAPFAFGALPTSTTTSAPAFAFGSTSTPASAFPTNSPAPEPIVEDTDPNAVSINSRTAGGAGEEGESMIHEVRGKVYRLDGTEAVELGLGQVMIKEKDGVRRLLARNGTTGNVMINFRLTGTSLPLKCEKAFVTFQGFLESTPTIYRIRVKGTQEIEELRQHLNESSKQ